MNINSINTRADINEVMSKIREVSDKSKIFAEKHIEPTAGGFESMLSVAKDAVSQVNQTQTAADTMKTALLSGDGGISMSQVVVAAQKSKLAFEGLLAVRNKILEAYKEIMNMQI